MKQEQGNGAVLYIRVSTEEQAKEPMNLGKQEKQCRDLCKQMGVPVVKMFVGSGESARSVDRMEFQRMLA